MSQLADPVGILLVVLTLVLVAKLKTFGNDRILHLIVVLAVLVRTAVSVANILIGPILDLKADAVNFQLEAVKFATGQGISVGIINGWVYSAFLGTLYRFTGGGLLLGQQISILAAVLSAASIVRIMRRLGGSNQAILVATSIVLFLPSGIVYTSGTLREAFQQLFLLLTVEFGLRTIDSPSVRNLVVLTATTVAGGSLHGAVALASAIIAAGAVLIAGVTRVPHSSRRFSYRPLLPLVLCGVLLVGVSVPTLIFPYRLGDGSLAAATSYRQSAFEGRADYLRFEAGDRLTPAAIPLVFGLYVMAPLPWQVTTLPDTLALMEALTRAVLVMLALLSIVHASRGGQLKLFQVLLLAGGWLALELLWSVGTSNWGTAARHHVVAFPLLVIVAALGPGFRPRSAPAIETRSRVAL